MPEQLAALHAKLEQVEESLKTIRESAQRLQPPTDPKVMADLRALNRDTLEMLEVIRARILKKIERLRTELRNR